jgi:hypothetical protein
MYLAKAVIAQPDQADNTAIPLRPSLARTNGYAHNVHCSTDGIGRDATRLNCWGFSATPTSRPVLLPTP